LYALLILRSQRSPLFPYTTLFRSTPGSGSPVSASVTLPEILPVPCARAVLVRADPSTTSRSIARSPSDLTSRLLIISVQPFYRAPSTHHPRSSLMPLVPPIGDGYDALHAALLLLRISIDSHVDTSPPGALLLATLP